MNRSPLFFPLNRGGDNEAGGAADLQTDVMRFMAILSLCLVAIFALLHSIPIEQNQPPEPVVADSVDEPTVDVAEPVREPVAEPEADVTPVVDAQQIDLQYPERADPVSVAVAELPAKPEPQPAVEPVEAAPEVAATEETSEPAAAEPAEGFSLRFEDDIALTRLVARNEIGMYAMTDERSMRMNVNRGDIGFWAASTPQEFHEMERSTVPEPVVSAYRHSGDASLVKWGVTLPPAMSRELNQFLSQNTGGAIIIEADGGLRLEP